MNFSAKQQQAAAARFATRWAGKGYEKGQSQIFWTELLTEVFGVESPSTFISFEDQVHLDHTSFIDGYIHQTHVMIEQKSLDKDLNKPIRQSDGTELTPFQQAKRYSAELPYDQRPRWIVTCNFQEFHVYDMNRPQGEPEVVRLSDLGKDYYRLQFLVENERQHLQKEMEVSMKAGEIVARIYDAFVGQYDADDPRSLRYLNILCVRLVFCLYAEDAGIFGRRDQFHDYLAHYQTEDLRNALLRLFQVLNTPQPERSRYLKDDLKAFPYTNGGLFAEEIDIPQLTDEIRELLLQHASLDFDWSEISPTIFGGVFESTLNPETRRSGGMHYTSIENIHKVIDPLFLDGLRQELDAILGEREVKKRCRQLVAYQQRLASLRFFDPACGSGNFLTETYLSLRRLENRMIQALYSEVPLDAFTNPIRVSIHQFYGIEINDFAVTVATTALWISEAQTMAETERIIHHDIDFLPLKSYANIHEGNALRLDWPSIVAPDGEAGGAQPQPSPLYIIGNPPFVGARMMSEAQKQDMLAVFGSQWKNVGNIDYVGAWYKLCADFMRGTSIEAALVSTNSIAQGEQVANLWQPLFEQGIRINFAHRTFRWDSEASIMAHVHCVIIGFSYNERAHKCIFDGENTLEAHNINAYLTDASNTFVGSRSHPLCAVPEIGIGNKPIDGGNYLFTREEMEAFVKKEPKSAPLFHLWYGSQEFIHRQPRYCLWLGQSSPHEIASMPLCMERVSNVRQLRLDSKSAGTRKLADRPTRFHVENMPDGDAIIVPRVSSERREYVPMGYIQKGVFGSDAVHLIPNATLYHFGVLESSVHMAWMRTVCGRLKSDYRYSKDVVYNNFVWPMTPTPSPSTPTPSPSTPTPSPSPREGRTSGSQLPAEACSCADQLPPLGRAGVGISKTAQAILDARALYPDASLAELYDPTLMPPELRRAHRDNDRAVLQAYGWPRDLGEQDIVARLFALYEQATKP